MAEADQPAHSTGAARSYASRRRTEISEKNIDEPCEAVIGEPKALDAGTSSLEGCSSGSNRDLLSDAMNGEIGETYIRVKRKGSGFTGSLFNGVNALTGIGILSTPYATAQAGWLSLTILIFFSVVCCYTAVLLKRCMDHGRVHVANDAHTANDGNNHGGLHEPLLIESHNGSPGELVLDSEQSGLNKAVVVTYGQVGGMQGEDVRSAVTRTPRSYPDIGDAAYGQTGRWVTALMLYMELFCAGVELLILEGDNISHLFPLPASVASSLPLSLTQQNLYTIIAAIVILPTVWLRDISLLAYISAGGVAASILVVAGVAWIGAIDGIGFFAASSPHQLFHAAGIPAAIGLFAFCLAGHAVFPNMYLAMADKKHYTPVLITTFSVSTALYVGIAALGFCMFGDALKTQVTLNLPPALPAATVVIWTTVVNPLTKFALTLMPLALALEDDGGCVAHDHDGSSRWKSIAVRSALVGATLFVALAVPFFGYVMAFIGSFLSLTSAVILPCLFHLRIMRHQLGKGELFLNYSLVAVGSVCAVVGTWYSVRGIIDSWHL